MTEQQLAAMEQALEALIASDDFLFNYHYCEPNNEREMDSYSLIRINNLASVTALRTIIEQAKRQQALDKMAENERRLGIQMQPEPVTMNDAIAAGNGVLMNEQAALLRECRAALDSLIQKKPTLAGLLCGSTTLGNLKASLYDYRPQGVFGTTTPAAPVQQDQFADSRNMVAAPVQEPVAWAVHYKGPIPLFTKTKSEAEAWGGNKIVPLYTTPPTVPVQETSGCQHKRYSVDVHEQTGTCYDCGAEGRMRFVVGDATSPTAPVQEK